MKTSSFKTKARQHQIQFRRKVLCLNRGEYQTYLTDRDAEAGRNFHTAFPGLLDVVQDRYSFNRRGIMYEDMLRSEHIPFNFFGPLKLDESGEIAGRLIRDLIGFKGTLLIRTIEFEWPRSVKDNRLGDRTAFDVFVLCKGRNGKSIGVGIEVKYTEKSYALGKTEQRRMLSKKSKYHYYTEQSGLYRDDAMKYLARKMLKQPWRNHLLGASMAVERDLNDFFSVLLYPSGNQYQEDVAKAYSTFLKPEYASRFVPLTFERFIEIGRAVCVQHPMYMSWIDYLERRYIVT